MVIISSSLASLPPVLPTLICSAHQYQINLPKVPFSDVAVLIQGPSVGLNIPRIMSKLICLVSKALYNLALYSLFLFPFSTYSQVRMKWIMDHPSASHAFLRLEHVCHFGMCCQLPSPSTYPIATDVVLVCLLGNWPEDLIPTPKLTTIPIRYLA